jgi:ABC-type multidrug transport system fused ATPase/permease subunit
MQLVPPLILARIIDFLTGGFTSLKPFYILLFSLLGVSIFAKILRNISKYFLAVFNNNVQTHVKVKTFEKMVQNDLAWHENQNTGEKIDKINDGKKAIGDFISFYVNDALPIIVSLAGILTIFSIFGWKYTIITTIYMLVHFTFTGILNKSLGKKSFKAKLAKESAIGKSYEFSSNMSTIKLLGLEEKAVKEIEDKEKVVAEKRISRRWTDGKKWIGIGIISSLFYAIYLFFIGQDVLAGTLTIGSIIIYIDYVRKLDMIFVGISGQALKVMDMKQGVMRMMGIYHTLPEIDESNAKNMNTWDEIKFKDVSFAYDKKNVLENFNFEIKKGEKIGIVGSSGGGKSTFFKLLLKLYMPKSGKIFFNNKSNEKITRKSILKKISVVPQETELFNLSIRENIQLAKDGRYDSVKYKEALNKSQLTSFVSNLPAKDFTIIGEKGAKLSGGQRQRLGIARAIYKDSDIIILDEATSNLDYETEKRFQKAVDALKGKTMIVAAHRLSTLQNMDRIVLLDKGKIAEEGTYEELIKKKGKFWALWKAQKH